MMTPDYETLAEEDYWKYLLMVRLRCSFCRVVNTGRETLGKSAYAWLGILRITTPLSGDEPRVKVILQTKATLLQGDSFVRMS